MDTRGATHAEDVPGSIRHDAILDEAKFAVAARDQTCVELTIRTEVDHDEPLSQYNTTFAINGREMRSVFDNERVTVVDYTFEGMRTVVSAEGIAANEYIGLNLERPATRIFRLLRCKDNCSKVLRRSVANPNHSTSIVFDVTSV
jgi:hypothetical protein